MQMIIENNMVIPNELKERKQWVLWRLEPIIDKVTKRQKVDMKTGELLFTKVPYQFNGRKASSTNPEHWASYEEVILNQDNFNGIGYVLSECDPYIAIDLDNHIIDGELSKEAKEIVEKTNSFTEISQSGTGLHIFVKAKKPGNRSKNSEKGFEMYDNNRFMIMTGNHLEGTPTEINESQMIVEQLYDIYFSKRNEKESMEKANISNLKPSPNLMDDEVVKLASNAKNGHKFKALFNGVIDGYGSQSEADLALCSLISFYTQDFEQIDRLFKRSNLYRDKWDEKRGDTTYGKLTIKNAIYGLTATYQGHNFRLSAIETENGLEKTLLERGIKERKKAIAEWEANGGRGHKPSMLSPLSCALVLKEYIEFILFDLEENTRLAMYQRDKGIYTRNTTIIKRVISWLEPDLNSNKADEVIYHLTNRADIKKPTISRYLIPVENGIFNLETKQLEPFSPDYIFTSKISTPYIETDFSPALDGWDVESWLSSIACGDKEIVHLLWQVINDSLNGNYSRKKAIFLVGDGNNGKGTFQELVTNLIGSENIATLKVNEFEERFKLSVIDGKTTIIGDDVPANVYIDDSSNFNSVVTGDRVLVEEKNKQPYSAVFNCGVIQSTNGMPKFRNKTVGTLRRILIVPFNANFNGQVENFKIKDDYIKNEKVLQYVLYKAINMDFERFDEPAASKQALEIFKQDNDPVLDFKYSVFDEWTIPELPKYLVYNFYKNFCNDNGFKPLSNRQFHKRFSKHLGEEWNANSLNRFDAEYLQMHLGDLFGYDIRSPKTPDKSYKRLVTE